MDTVRRLKLKVLNHLVKAIILISLSFSGSVLLVYPQYNGEEITDSVQTKKGELKIIKVIEGDALNVKIELGDKIIKDGTDSPYLSGKIAGKYPAQSPSLFLIRLSNDSTACAAGFVVIDLSRKSPIVTREFGNCSDSPKTTYRGKNLLIFFPAEQGGKKVWQYKSGKLSEIK